MYHRRAGDRPRQRFSTAAVPVRVSDPSRQARSRDGCPERDAIAADRHSPRGLGSGILCNVNGGRAALGFLALAALASACGSSRPVVNPQPPPATTTTSAAGIPTTGPRSAAATIGYVRRLVAQGQLPHASAVKRVWADGPIIVVSTTLTDRGDAEDLYEKLSTATGCDDSFLFVRGQRVILKDGSVVTAARPGYRTCAGT